MTSIDSFDPDSMAQFMTERSADERLLVAHVLPAQQSGSAAEAITRATKATRALKQRFPGLLGARTWIVHLVGDAWEDKHRDLARRALAASGDLALGGVLIIGRSGQAAVQQLDVEAMQAGVDLIQALRATPTLERQLGERPTAWLCGCSSVRYDVEAATASLAARRTARYIRRLVEPDLALSAARPAGEQLVDGLSLASAEEQLRLSFAGQGGSVLTEFRLTGVLERERFDEIPVEDWPSVVAAAADELLLIRLPLALDQVRRNALARLAELSEVISTAVLSEFRGSQNIPATKNFITGMQLGLESSRRAVSLQRAGHAEFAFERELDVLRRRCRHFPHRAAVVVRFLLLAVVSILLTRWLAGSVLDQGMIEAERSARAIGALTALAAPVVYSLRWRRLVRARDVALRALEEDIELRVQRAILDARVDLLEVLARHLDDPWTERLKRLETAGVVHLRRLGDVDNDSSLQDSNSRYAARLPMRVPSRDRQAVEAQLDELDRVAERRLAEGLAAMSLDLGQSSLDDVVREVSPEYRKVFADDLGQHLRASPTDSEVAASVIAQNVLPVIAAPVIAAQHTAVTRFLCVGAGDTTVGDALRPPDVVGVAATSVEPCHDPDFAAFVHLINVGPVLL